VDAEDIVELARVLPRDQFVNKFTNLLLVIAEVSPESQPMGFQTIAASPGAHRRPAPRPPSAEVLHVAKAKGNPYPDQISVGRTRNCDVVLRHRSVSKLHAHFKLDDKGLMCLVDDGSQNGTRVNGQVLKPGVPQPITVGDVVQFGHLTATISDAAGVFEMLRHRRMPGQELGR
jgi:hypothetical protein